MKFVRDFLDKIKPNFEKGGKFPWLHSTFDAFETFAFVPKTTTTSGAHFRDAMDMKRTMTMVILALMPALLFGTYNIGFQHFHSINPELSFFEGFWDNLLYGAIKILPIIVISYVVGLSIEFGFAQWRKHDVNEGFLVTGMLIPLVMPPDVPLWQVALATAFAVVIGKEVFGGTGMNFLNPALLARAFLFFAYPTHMSGDNVWISARHFGDAITGATPLGQIMTSTAQNGQQLADSLSYSALNMLVGTIPGSIGETSVIAILLGAFILLLSGMASWRIMLSVLLGGGAMGLLFNAIGANAYMQLPFYYHFLMGGFMFGAVFMATDPVTSAQTNTGKWIYGILIGAFAVLIRVLNPAYPEGMMLSILLMNCFAPLIDHCVVACNTKYRKARTTK